MRWLLEDQTLPGFYSKIRYFQMAAHGQAKSVRFYFEKWADFTAFSGYFHLNSTHASIPE
ncbi:MAG TPA: hypothetical protein VFN35_17095 [Ktedonobacteraceae bacterium]|nr:hypothetical protein [Ktedonobacteraceae bacterium]